MTKKCPDCGKGGMKNVGMHIAQTECEYPELDDEAMEVLTGILMGDGHIREDGIFEVSVNEKEYLEYVKEEIPNWFVTDSGISVQISETSEDGYLWRLRSVSCDHMREMRSNWYDDGEKVYPIDDISLSGTVLAHWYVNDGGIDGQGRPTIYSSNEDTNKLMRWLKDATFDVCADSKSVRFNKDGAEKLMDEIGGPVAGYEYKFDL